MIHRIIHINNSVISGNIYIDNPLKAIEDFAKAGPVNDEVLSIIGDDLTAVAWNWEAEYLVYKQIGEDGWITFWEYQQIKNPNKFKKGLIENGAYDHAILYDLQKQKLVWEIKEEN